MALAAGLAGARAEGDNAAESGPAHRGQCPPCAEECAGQIHLYRAPPRLWRDLFERLDDVDACIQDEQLDRTELLLDPPEGRVDRRLGGNVELDAEHTVDVGCAQVADGDTSVLVAQRLRDAATDPAPAAGDEGNAAVDPVELHGGIQVCRFGSGSTASPTTGFSASCGRASTRRYVVSPGVHSTSSPTRSSSAWRASRSKPASCRLATASTPVRSAMPPGRSSSSSHGATRTASSSVRARRRSSTFWPGSIMPPLWAAASSVVSPRARASG